MTNQICRVYRLVPFATGRYGVVPQCIVSVVGDALYLAKGVVGPGDDDCVGGQDRSFEANRGQH